MSGFKAVLKVTTVEFGSSPLTVYGRGPRVGEGELDEEGTIYTALARAAGSKMVGT